MNQTSLPARARAVVIGGGIVGCSTAYALARAGWDDVVLLERKSLTSGTTWHSAGFVLHVQPTPGLVGVVRESMRIMRSLEDETGLATGFHQTGQMRLALSEDRLSGLLRQASVARAQGTRVAQLTTDEALEQFPWFNPEGVVGAVLYPDDGRANPTDTTMALAKGARQRGARILENTKVNQVVVRNGRAVGVETDRGDIQADVVVNCTGMWGREFGALHGVPLPLQAVAHYYVVTTPIADMPRTLAGVSSSDEHVYVGPEGDGLLVGFFEPNSATYASRGIPEHAEFVTLEEDWDHLGPFYEKAIARFPVLADAGIRLFLSGPESFTPDGFYNVGRVAGIDNYYAAAGFNSSGFLSGPGIGSYLARLITQGAPSSRLIEVDPRRAQPHQTNRRYLETATVETLGTTMNVHYPYEETAAPRGIRRGPLHERHRALGATFGNVNGWEVVNYFAAETSVGDFAPSFGQPGWLDHSAREHLAARHSVALADISHHMTLLVQGPDAAALLGRVGTSEAPPVDTGCVTLWLNEEGGIEARVAITCIAASSYLIVSESGWFDADADWLQQHVAEGEIVTTADVTAGWAELWLLGPSATSLLQEHTDVELSSENFAIGDSRIIDVGLARVRARRGFLAGEAGWSLSISTEYAAHVYEALLESRWQPTPIGAHALSSLAVENGSPTWAMDFGPDTKPHEVGLAHLVDSVRTTDFIGREAVVPPADDPNGRRLVRVAATDPGAMMFGGEPLYRGDRVVGWMGSAMFAHSLERCAGLVSLDGRAVAPLEGDDDQPLEVDIRGRRCSLSVCNLEAVAEVVGARERR